MVIIVLRSLKRGASSIETNLKENNTFDFKRIMPGEFLLWSYIDSDSNGIYSSGSVDPLVNAEYFQYYPDTLNLRARWPVGDININMSK